MLLKDEVYAVAVAAMDVYYTLGSGFLEPIYQEAMQIELNCRRIPFKAQEEFTLFYKDVEMKKKYIPDFVCY